MHDLAVGIVSWNTRDLTLACLDSLMAELARLQVTSVVWVVDNASEDDSVAAIAAARPDVVLVRNDENLGFARANNQFLRGCEARRYLLLNPDSVVHEGALARLLEAADAHPDAGAVGPRLILGDGSIQRSFWALPTLGRELSCNLMFRFPPFGGLFARLFAGRLPNLADLREPRPVEALSMACLLIDGAVLQEVGLLAEEYFLFSEENDLFVRMAVAGRRGYYVPTAEVTHLVGQSRSKQEARRSAMNFFRSRSIYFAKHHPETLGRYRRLSAFFLGWLRLYAQARRALGRAEPEDVDHYRELLAVLAETTGFRPGSERSEGESAC